MHPGTLEPICVMVVEDYTSWRGSSCVWPSPLRLLVLCLPFLNKIGMYFWWVCFLKFLWRITECYFFKNNFLYCTLVYIHIILIFAIFTYFKAFGLTFGSTLSLRRYMIFITYMGFVICDYVPILFIVFSLHFSTVLYVRIYFLLNTGAVLNEAFRIFVYFAKEA